MYNLHRMAGRPPKPPDQVLVNIGVRVPARVKEELAALSARDGFENVTDLVRQLVLLGRAAYASSGKQTRELFMIWSELGARDRRIVVRLAQALREQGENDRVVIMEGQRKTASPLSPGRQPLRLRTHDPEGDQSPEANEQIQQDIEDITEVFKPKKHK